ncbi:hypothetical protein C8J57DRAFT_1515421 [Mycena rebaudengoi]|nr:hypothetical protein C8J57DRAFT_1515421 [Mycena rebaudengoi]
MGVLRPRPPRPAFRSYHTTPQAAIPYGWGGRRREYYVRGARGYCVRVYMARARSAKMDYLTLRRPAPCPTARMLVRRKANASVVADTSSHTTGMDAPRALGLPLACIIPPPRSPPALLDELAPRR